MSVLPKPTTEQIETLRDLFLKKLEKEGSPCEGGFHQNDLNRIKANDLWVQLFLEQSELDMKQALKMLWDTCTWRKDYGTNDINENNVRMDYLESGIIFPRNKDKDGKTLLIFKTKQHTKGSKDVNEMIRCLVYWIERLHRKENYNRLTILFDMQATGLSNMDMDFTRRIIDTFKFYYPNSLNYIIIYEMPWILNAAFKIIKALLPPKAVAIMKFVNSKNMKEFVNEGNMLVAWGGTDDYEFSFKSEEQDISTSPIITSEPLHTDSDSTNHINSSVKKVHFANPSPTESPMTETATSTLAERGGDGEMLQITPDDTIFFTKFGNELVGTVEISNVAQSSITYKIKTTSPEKFRVRPSTGVLAAGMNTNINVVLLQGQQISSLSKDKFLVMCLALPSDANTNFQGIADIWKNTSSNSPLVEQHRLKCSLPVNTTVDGVKNGRLNGSGYAHDADRQISHFSSSLDQLTDTTQRLEAQLKFTQNLQWITLIVFLVVLMAVVYILKREINSQNAEMSLQMLPEH